MAITDTDFPVTGTGGYDEPTWGEAGPVFSVPPNEAAGLASEILPSNTINYEWQHPARWIRSMLRRMPQADQVMFASWMPPSAVDWLLPGGTLDSSILPTRVWVDGSGDGSGRLVEFTVPVGAPHGFTALRDTYVGLDDAGAVEYQEVANGAGAPVPTVGFVHAWLIVTDGAQVASTFRLLGLVPLYMTMRTVANADVGGNLTVAGIVDGPITVGANSADTINLVGDVNFVNDVDLAAGKTLTLAAGADIVGQTDGRATIGTLVLPSGGPAPSATNELAGGVGGILAWHDGTAGRFVHFSANGIVYATGDQEPITASLTNQNVAETTVAVIASGNGSVRVIMEGYCQITVSGNNIDFHVQDDQGGFATIGTVQTDTCNKILDNDDWQYFRIERTFFAGSIIATKYRGRVDPIGASARVRNVNLRVVTER